MSTFRVDEAVSDYIVRSCTPPDRVVRDLIERTSEIGELYEMMVPPEQASFLTMLAHTIGARKIVDVGTFTGLSALSFARGLAPGGRVVTCDVTEDFVPIAREHWARAGLTDRIDFRLGPAWRTLQELAADDDRADIVFVDADKLSYQRYCRAAVPILRPGGLLILDNVLLHGEVVRPEDIEDELLRLAAQTMAETNAMIAADERLDVVMLPIGDGLTIARKR